MKTNIWRKINEDNSMDWVYRMALYSRWCNHSEHLSQAGNIFKILDRFTLPEVDFGLLFFFWRCKGREVRTIKYWPSFSEAVIFQLCISARHRAAECRRMCIVMSSAYYWHLILHILLSPSWLEGGYEMTTVSGSFCFCHCNFWPWFYHIGLFLFVFTSW